MIMATSGIIWTARMPTITILRPRKAKREMASAASIPTTTPITTTDRETIRLRPTGPQKSAMSSARRKLSSVSPVGNRLGSGSMASFAGLNAVFSIQ